MHELDQSQRQSRFKAGDAERRAIEFHILAGGMMRSVIRGDGIYRAIGEAREQCIAIFARGQRRIHFVARVVDHVFVNEREMMRRDFASDRVALLFCCANVSERRARGKMRDVQPRAGQRSKFHIATHANGFRLPREFP